jgi:hypothetical protein
MEIDCMIKEIKKMYEEGVTDIEIYYAEDMTKNVTDKWSVDVMQNRINTNCKLAWSWSVISTEEDKAYHEEYDDNSPPADYDIIVDKPFSDDIVCEAIQTWLYRNGLSNCDFNVVMIDLKAAAPYSGYVKSLMNRDLDAELETAEPLFMN